MVLVLDLTALGTECVLHFLTLLLSAQVGAETALGELERALVATDTQQLHDALLVGRETGDFAHDLLHEDGALGEFALLRAAGVPRRGYALRHDVALLQSDGDACLGHLVV